MPARVENSTTAPRKGAPTVNRVTSLKQRRKLLIFNDFYLLKH